MRRTTDGDVKVAVWLLVALLMLPGALMLALALSGRVTDEADLQLLWRAGGVAFGIPLAGFLSLRLGRRILG